MRRLLTAAALLALAIAAAPAGAGPVEYNNAWVRATDAGGDTVAYMNLRSDVAVSLVGVSSPLAKRGALHEMKTEDGMMKMRDLDKIDLPAHVIGNFEPGGPAHLMLFGVKRALKDGENLPLVLTFKDGRGRTITTKVSAEVRTVPSAHREEMEKAAKQPPAGHPGAAAPAADAPAAPPAPAKP